MSKRKITIATRGSQLALIQANMVKDWLENQQLDLRVELQIIKTTGDKILDSPLSKVGGKGLFVKEIEEAILRTDADIAVHSMKDVPTELPEGLHIVAIGTREKPNDVFISNRHKSLSELPAEAGIGTSSLRRQTQLLRRFPSIKIVDIRGNVNTRLKKLDSENLDGIILAAAGVIRMGWQDKITEMIGTDICIPAVGQGAIGIESRMDDDFINNILSAFDHSLTHQCIKAERALMRTLEGGCQVPIGGFANYENDKLMLHGMVSSLDGQKMLLDQVEGALEDAEVLGESLAEIFLQRGAREILQEIRL